MFMHLLCSLFNEQINIRLETKFKEIELESDDHNCQVQCMQLNKIKRCKKDFPLKSPVLKDLSKNDKRFIAKK